MEIAAQIVRAAADGMSKTRIMYSVRLNHKQLTRYLRELAAYELLRLVEPSNRYCATDKGILFVKTVEDFRKTCRLANDIRYSLRNLFPVSMAEDLLIHEPPLEHVSV